MTTVLSTSPDVRAQWRETGRLARTAIGWVLFAIGWFVAKSLRAIAVGAGALFYAIGWVAASAVWPALLWCGRAVRLGWADGIRPGMKAG